MHEESVKVVYENEEPVGCIKQNGTLKFYKWVECSYGDIDQLFNAAPVSVPPLPQGRRRLVASNDVELSYAVESDLSSAAESLAAWVPRPEYVAHGARV